MKCFNTGIRYAESVLIGNLLKHFSVDFDVGIQENGFSIPRIGLGFLWTIEATNGMDFLADNE